jgi:hypothetical protein
LTKTYSSAPQSPWRAKREKGETIRGRDAFDANDAADTGATARPCAPTAAIGGAAARAAERSFVNELPQLAAEVGKIVARNVEPDTWLPLLRATGDVAQGPERPATRFGYAMAVGIHEALRAVGVPGPRLDHPSELFTDQPKEAEGITAMEQLVRAVADSAAKHSADLPNDRIVSLTNEGKPNEPN